MFIYVRLFCHLPQDFVQGLSILSRGSVEEKLRWTFSLYDINGDGFITREEMTDIVTAIYELMGRLPDECPEEEKIKGKVEHIFQVSVRHSQVHPSTSTQKHIPHRKPLQYLACRTMRITYVNYAISICVRLRLTAYLLCIMQIKLCISFAGHSSSTRSRPGTELLELKMALRWHYAAEHEHGHHVVVPAVQIAPLGLPVTHCH